MADVPRHRRADRVRRCAIHGGGLKRARELAALAFRQISLAAGEKISWTGGCGIVA